MLSVIVYGRNDAHGYNQHKRTAIGLNAMAAVLDDDDDEIIFVDYNTPDDHPTVIEAIGDTLTDACLARLRVIRVRPEQHRRLVAATAYPAPEAIARNVAARRANPANRWILSTNPDMVFTLRGGARSLSAIAAEAPAGFYQAPRFELPETLWERFDRQKPAETIAWLSEWGARLHINELVLVDPVIRFNGVGDFQLVRREDWFAIHGCHEGMTLGWNVDLNLCVRLNMLHGQTGSLLERLFAFHCSHGRQATHVHADNARMNDYLRFVEQVASPRLPEQAATWGMAGETLEEFRGASPPGLHYVPALAATLPGLGGEAWHVGWNDETTLFRLRYEPEHVLPYLLNHLFNLPRQTVVAWTGGDPRMFRLFRAAWRRLGREPALIATDAFPAPPIDPVFSQSPGDRLVGLDVIGREADVLVFDFGLNDGQPPENEPDMWFNTLSRPNRDRLGRVKGAFQRLCRMERRRMAAGGAARMIIAINAVNTFCGRLVESEIHFVRVPFSCRILHGHVRAAGPAAPPPREQTDFAAFLAAALGKREGVIDRYEAAIVEGDLERLRVGDLATISPRVFSPPALAALDWPAAGVAPERRAAICAAAAQRRPSATLAPLVAAPPSAAARPAGPPALNKLAASEDWDDPAWFALAHLFTIDGFSYRGSTRNYFKRSLGVWEATQMLYGLERTRAPDLDDRVAVVCAAPDGLPLFLTGRVGEVDMAIAPDADADQDWLGKRRLFHSGHIRVMAADQTGGPTAAPWAAALFPRTVAARNGWKGLVRWLAWADARLEDGGVTVFSADVAFTGDRGGGGDHWLDPVRAAALGPAAAARTGMSDTGVFDASLSAATLDRATESSDTACPHLAVYENGALMVRGVWVLRKRRETTPAEWAALAAWRP